MFYFITADGGHAMGTAGKETPKFDDGTRMKENEFNEACLKHFKEVFAYTPNVHILDVAPEVADTPLKTRTDRANAKLKELQALHGKENVKSVHVSFHANAYLGTWGTWGGQGVFYNVGSVQGRLLANAVLTELVKGTTLRNRGAKEANFHMLRETIAPAVLIEAAFMDNREEAALLKTEAFRKETGEDVARGVAKYLGITITEKPAPVAEKPLEGDKMLRVCVGSFKFRSGAEAQQEALKRAGFDSFLTIYEPK